MKVVNERKINEVQTEFSQLKDLMMAIIKKPTEGSPSISTQGLSKHPRSRLDIALIQLRTGEIQLFTTLPFLQTIYAVAVKRKAQCP